MVKLTNLSQSKLIRQAYSPAARGTKCLFTYCGVRVIAVPNVKNRPKTHRNHGYQSKASFQKLITQEQLENLGNRSNILYVVF